MPLAVDRAGIVRRIDVVADKHWTPSGSFFASPGALTWDYWAFIAGFVWMLLFAALLAWRRPESSAVRVIVVILIAQTAGSSLTPINWMTQLPSLDAVLAALASVVQYGGVALLATYAMLFARPPSRIRKTLAWLTYAGSGIAALYAITSNTSVWTAAYDPLGPAFTGTLAGIVQAILPWAFSLGCLFASVAAAKGKERTHISWATATLGLLFASQLVVNIAATFYTNAPSASAIGTQLLDVCAFFAPAVLTYSLLGRRLVDLEFVIGRAAVFATVSALILAVFVLLDWALGAVGHTTSVTANVVVALLIGLSIQYIHRRVERLVERILFRKRHDDDAALRRFAHEAGFVTDRERLLDYTVRTVAEHTDASNVSVLTLDGDRRYHVARGGGTVKSIDENDAALLAIRAHHEPLDLHRFDTVLHGDRAFPMASRGRLLGILVCGAKTSGETYAPDEIEALAAVAHGAGLALDALTREGMDVQVRILETQVRILDVQEKILAEMRSQTNRPGAS